MQLTVLVIFLLQQGTMVCSGCECELFITATIVLAKKLLITTQPQNAFAGEVFTISPIIKVTDDDGILLDTLNTGAVKAYLGVNPTGFASLQPSSNEFAIVNGIATCTGLYINQVGSGFTINFVSIAHGIQIESSTFDVIVGAPYKLAIATNPGTATGGLPFRPQPVLAIQDKGGNVVVTQNSGSVTVSLSENPAGGTLSPASALTVTFGSGIATFLGLNIDKAGTPYVLSFVTDLVLPGGTTASSFPFTIGVGPVNKVHSAIL